MQGNKTERRGGWIGAAAALALMIFAVTGVVRWIAGDGPGMARAMLKYAPPASAGLPESEYPGVAEMLTGYLTGGRPAFQYTWQTESGATVQAFHDYEAAHMADCRALIMLDTGVCVACLGIAAALTGGYAMFSRKRGRAAWIPFLRGGLGAFWGLTGVLATGVLWACIDFDSLFLLFHRLAFRNDLWLLNPRTDLLIRLMPESLFADLGVRGAGIAAAVLAATGIGMHAGLRYATQHCR